MLCAYAEGTSHKTLFQYHESKSILGSDVLKEHTGVVGSLTITMPRSIFNTGGESRLYAR